MHFFFLPWSVLPEVRMTPHWHEKLEGELPPPHRKSEYLWIAGTHRLEKLWACKRLMVESRKPPAAVPGHPWDAGCEAGHPVPHTPHLPSPAESSGKKQRGAVGERHSAASMLSLHGSMTKQWWDQWAWERCSANRGRWLVLDWRVNWSLAVHL